jgi:hypothetical protein
LGQYSTNREIAGVFVDNIVIPGKAAVQSASFSRLKAVSTFGDHSNTRPFSLNWVGGFAMSAKAGMNFLQYVHSPWKFLSWNLSVGVG